MIKFKFCIKDDCRTACQAKSEKLAWEWLSATKKLSVKQVKKLYTIVQEND